MSSTYEGKTHEQPKRSRSAILRVTTKPELKLRPLFDNERENVTTDNLSYLRAVPHQPVLLPRDIWKCQNLTSPNSMVNTKVGLLSMNNFWHQWIALQLFPTFKNYLKASLTGEALQSVSHLPLSDSYYKIALKSLTDCYNNERLIVNSDLNAILQLKPLRSESAPELRQLFVSFEENLMAIEALNVDTKDSNFIWVRVISEKLTTNLKGNGNSITQERSCKHLTNYETSSTSVCKH